MIEKDMKGKLRKLNHTLEDLFKTEKCTFVKKTTLISNVSGSKVVLIN